MVRKELYINGKRFYYDDESKDITYETLNPITEEDAIKILEKTKDLFDQINLPISLCFGTLLGAVRDKRIIPGDEDVDVFVDDEQKLYEHLPWLYDNGLKLCRMGKGKYYSFRISENAFIDVYILREIKKSIWRFNCLYLSCLVTPKKFFKSYSTIEFYNKQYSCPSHPERLLEFWYGKNWRIPTKGHKYYYEVKSAYYWRKVIRPNLVNILKKTIIYKYWNRKRDNNK